MSSVHLDLITNYVPSELHSPNLKLLSEILTEWRDYKFSNGFFFVGLELKGEYNNKDICTNLDRLNTSQMKELLDNLNHIDKNLFTLAQKVFTNTASTEEFNDYIDLLIKTNIMQYSWKRFNDVHR